MAPRTPESPATPHRRGVESKSSDPGRDQAARLNRKYKLGIPLSEEPLSPAQKEQRARTNVDFQRHNSIVNLLRFHYYKGTTQLQSVLDDFDDAVQDVTSDWGYRSLRSNPVPTGLARQVLLQKTLLDVLDDAKTFYNKNVTQDDPSKSSACQKKDAKRGGMAADVVPESQGSGLRILQNIVQNSSDDEHDDSSSGTGGGSDIAADIDSVPVHTQLGASVLRSAANPEVQEWKEEVPRELTRSPSSSSVSSAMFSAMDSFEETQTTADFDDKADSAEDKSPSQTLRRSLSQESFPMSESDLEAFENTIQLYDDPASSDRNEPSSPCSIPEMASLHLSDPAADAPDVSLPAEVPGLQDRLTSVFPTTPNWLAKAPFPIVWEMTRISVACNVDLNSISMSYSAAWRDQDEFRKSVSRHPSFAGKMLPERSDQLAWTTALSEEKVYGSSMQTVVYMASLSYNLDSSGPLYFVTLRSLALDKSHRLSRQFGADRFLEVVFPTHHSSHWAVPHVLYNDDVAIRQVNKWLTRQRHAFVGRHWAAFFTKNAERKKTSNKDETPGKRSENIVQERISLFSETGLGIPATAECPVTDVLEWLLMYNQFPENRSQPYLKLFSRIALGLSRTNPTVVFEPHQLRIRSEDIRSSIKDEAKGGGQGEVMNDGVARMSLSVARKLRSELALSDLPTAIQGRLGSAKGMWILDTEDPGCEDWIETYPAQRKWKCDSREVNHRTLEVRKHVSEARSADLNKQFLFILEDRALDKDRMHRVLGDILKGSLSRELEQQKAALKHPLLLLSWVHENACYKSERSKRFEVPFLGGIPDRDEEMLQLLLKSGFNPQDQKFMWEKVYDMQKQKCERLKENLHVRVGRTAYLLMVVDFLGVLEEGEVQVCFSSKFQTEADCEPDSNGDDGSFSDTLLVGREVLVARTPAHFPSDMQKVKAVFRPELRALKDVIIFSSKGASPLATKLSGGDYDGDLAWVCWDPRIVDNFANAPDPEEYDLRKMGYMRKVKTTLAELAPTVPLSQPMPQTVVEDMIESSFQFNMRENLLGKLTVYKEHLCYQRGTIGDKTAAILSTLLSDLVDQAKQGYDFTSEDFKRLRTEQLEGLKRGRPPPENLVPPAYKGSSWGRKGRPITHLVDYLKFAVTQPVIKSELRALHASRLTGRREDGACPEFWDPDLAEPAKHFEALAKTSAACHHILQGLKADIREVKESWDNSTKKWKATTKQVGSSQKSEEDLGYRERLLRLYEQWRQIPIRLPEAEAEADGGPSGNQSRHARARSDTDTALALLRQDYLADPDYSQWALIRASQTFRMWYRSSPGLAWKMAGRQLAVIKALTTDGKGRSGNSLDGCSGGSISGLQGAKVMMTAASYAACRPDSKVVKKIAAKLQKEAMESDDEEFFSSYEDDT